MSILTCIVYLLMIHSHYNFLFSGVVFYHFTNEIRLNVKRTKNLNYYVFRLFVLSLISQIPYSLVVRDGAMINDVASLWFISCLFSVRRNSFIEQIGIVFLFVAGIFGVVSILIPIIYLIVKYGYIQLYATVLLIIDYQQTFIFFIYSFVVEKKWLTNKINVKYNLNYLIYPLHFLLIHFIQEYKS